MDPQQVIDQVTQRVRETANVEAVFGDPIEAKGVTMIPVARVKVAGGGGGGIGRPRGDNAESGKPDRGMGLGMRVTAAPIGYIEIADGKARMVEIVDKNKVALGGLMVGGLFLLTVMRLAA